jgi:protein CrcB
MSPLLLLALALAGAAGAVTRVYMARTVSAWQASRLEGASRGGGRASLPLRTLPLGTLAVNVAGALAAGIVAGATPVLPTGTAEAAWPLVLGIGFLGALTTFSTWMVESWRRLASAPGRSAGLLHVGASVLLGVAAAVVGVALGACIRGAA